MFYYVEQLNSRPKHLGLEQCLSIINVNKNIKTIKFFTEEHKSTSLHINVDNQQLVSVIFTKSVL